MRLVEWVDLTTVADLSARKRLEHVGMMGFDSSSSESYGRLSNGL